MGERVVLRESSPVRFIIYNSSHFFPCSNLVRFPSWVLARVKQLGPSVSQGSKLCCTGQHHFCKGIGLHRFLHICWSVWIREGTYSGQTLVIVLRVLAREWWRTASNCWFQTSELTVAQKCAVLVDWDRIAHSLLLGLSNHLWWKEFVSHMPCDKPFFPHYLLLNT